MYRIFILTDDTKLGQQLGLYTKKYCEQNGSFPILRQFENSEEFCNALKTEKPTGVIIALPGAAALPKLWINMVQRFGFFVASLSAASGLLF